jgi:BlaI family penicillinase repressor
MGKPLHAGLSRRERLIMDILFRRGRASAAEVMAELSGNPSYSTVRTQLRVLEDKGHVRHEDDGVRYVYVPAVPRHAARKSALRHLVETFFEGSTEKAVAALLGGEAARITEEDLDRIAQLLAEARNACGHADPSTGSGSSRAASRDEPKTSKKEGSR